MFWLTNIKELNERLKQLKLEKRELILAGKKTSCIDDKIREVEEEISNLQVN